MNKFTEISFALKLEPAEFHKKLCMKYGLSYVAVYKWRIGRIPADRLIEIVRDFDLDPKFLIGK